VERTALTHKGIGIIPLTVLSALLFIALLMMNAATQNSSLFGNMYSSLLLINVLGVILLLGLILFNIYHLFIQLRARAVGSRLTLRLLGVLVLLAVTPVSVVYFFSLQALNRGIDSWFDVKIEQAMDDALMLGRTAFDALKQDLAATAEDMAIELENTSDKLALTALNYLREQHNVSELTLYNPNGQIIASSSKEGPDLTSLIPIPPDETVMSQIRQGLTYANLDPVGTSDLRLRVVVPVYGNKVGSPVRTLQVLQQLPNRYTKLGESVQSAFAEYEKLAYLRGPLKFGFTLSLSLVALMTMLIVVSGAIFTARRVVKPLRDLAEGTEAVAKGDYSKQLPAGGDDEFGMLARSFNEMTHQVHRAQTQLRRSQFEAEAQRTYLETVLEHLSSGVISFDQRQRLRTYNSAAVQILGINLENNQKKPLASISTDHEQLAPFVDTVREAVSNNQQEWHADIVLYQQAGRRVLMLRGTKMSALTSRRSGYVVVFDDVTALIQAQRDAAWGEVARRLAHEIKNPLTPIQLSAERIRHKCMKQLDEKTQNTLERATTTIIDQVEALKTMVNAFSDYARPMQMQRQPVDLNTLIKDIKELYRVSAYTQDSQKQQSHPNLSIELDLDDELPKIMADPGRLRQILHNLMLNAGEALAGKNNSRVRITTRCITKDNCHTVHLSIEDNGSGIPPEMMDRLFEPYVTSKEKGTGLGLAIVKKIVEEHSGSLWVENIEKGGACIHLHLPVNPALETGNKTNAMHNVPSPKESQA